MLEVILIGYLCLLLLLIKIYFLYFWFLTISRETDEHHKASPNLDSQSDSKTSSSEIFLPDTDLDDTPVTGETLHRCLELPASSNTNTQTIAPNSDHTEFHATEDTSIQPSVIHYESPIAPIDSSTETVKRNLDNSNVQISDGICIRNTKTSSETMTPLSDSSYIQITDSFIQHSAAHFESAIASPHSSVETITPFLGGYDIYIKDDAFVIWNPTYRPNTQQKNFKITYNPINTVQEISAKKHEMQIEEVLKVSVKNMESHTSNLKSKIPHNHKDLTLLAEQNKKSIFTVAKTDEFHGIKLKSPPHIRSRLHHYNNNVIETTEAMRVADDHEATFMDRTTDPWTPYLDCSPHNSLDREYQQNNAHMVFKDHGTMSMSKEKKQVSKNSDQFQHRTDEVAQLSPLHIEMTSFHDEEACLTKPKKKSMRKKLVDLRKFFRSIPSLMKKKPRSKTFKYDRVV